MPLAQPCPAELDIMRLMVLYSAMRNHGADYLFRRIGLSLALLLLGLTPGWAQNKAIHPKDFPTGRPFSPGILTPDGTLYVAGQIGQDLKTGKVPENFEEEVKLTLDNVGAILKEAGFEFKDSVSVHVYLTDITLFQRMNAVYTTYFPEPRPARTTVGVTKLAAPTARIEITVTAHKRSARSR